MSNFEPPKLRPTKYFINWYEVHDFPNNSDVGVRSFGHLSTIFRKKWCWKIEPAQINGNSYEKTITDSERTEHFLSGSIQHLYWFRCGCAILSLQNYAKSKNLPKTVIIQFLKKSRAFMYIDKILQVKPFCGRFPLTTHLQWSHLHRRHI